MASFVIDKMFAILHTCKTARCVLLLAGLLAVFHTWCWHKIKYSDQKPQCIRKACAVLVVFIVFCILRFLVTQD